jgi:prevent-host-death family protein
MGLRAIHLNPIRAGIVKDLKSLDRYAYTGYSIIMGKLMNILPISDLRQDAAKILKKLREINEPIIITQRGRAAAVIIGVEAYEKSEHDKEILRLLAKGEKEIEIVEGYDLDTVLAEADVILSQEPS